MERDKKLKKSYKNVLVKIKEAAFGSRRRVIISAVILLILGFFVWRAFGQETKQPQYQTSQVERGTIIQTVSESGNVASGSQAGVGSPTKGIVTEIYVRNGDSVNRGDNLFKVKSIASAQEVASAWASYQNAVGSANTAANSKITNQSKLEQDRQAIINASTDVTNMQYNLDRSQDNPATKQKYTQNDIDAINSALTSARYTFSADEQKYLQSDQSIAAASAAKNSAWLSYEATQDSVVTAPIGGTIANISVQTGDQVSASSGNLSSELNSNNSSSTSTGSTVLSIGNYATPYIKVQASEVDVPKIQAGQKAIITLDAFSGKTYVGKVDQVDTAGTISSSVVTYNVFVSFIAPPENIRPGMSATVSIETSRKDDVLFVPSSAVQNTGGETTVRVPENGKITSVPVETGLTSDSDTEIISGLKEGQTIVTSIIMNTGGTSGSSPFSGGLRFGGGIGGGNVRTGGGGR